MDQYRIDVTLATMYNIIERGGRLGFLSQELMTSLSVQLAIMPATCNLEFGISSGYHIKEYEYICVDDTEDRYG